MSLHATTLPTTGIKCHDNVPLYSSNVTTHYAILRNINPCKNKILCYDVNFRVLSDCSHTKCPRSGFPSTFQQVREIYSRLFIRRFFLFFTRAYLWLHIRRVPTVHIWHWRKFSPHVYQNVVPNYYLPPLYWLTDSTAIAVSPLHADPDPVNDYF